MKLLSFLIVSFLILTMFIYPDIEFDKNWKIALEKGKKEGKKIFFDFYTDWCPPCKKLSNITFKDKKMEEYFKKENYILVKINPEKDREAETYFKVYSYPTMVIFNEKGVEVDRILGFRNTDELISELTNIQKGIGTLVDLLVKYNKKKKDFELMFKIVDKYIARADYSDALTLLDRVIDLDKTNIKGMASKAISKKGYIFYKWKKNKKSIETMLSIHKRYPSTKEAIDGFYAAYYYAKKAGDIKRSIEILKEFTRLYPGNKYYKRYKKEL